MLVQGHCDVLKFTVLDNQLCLPSSHFVRHRVTLKIEIEAVVESDFS
jgi:hypothetical protein